MPMKRRFITQSLPDGDWNQLDTVLSLPQYVFELQIYDSVSAMQVRYPGEGSEIEEYAKNEVYSIRHVIDQHADLSMIEIKGTSGDTIRGEYLI